MTALAVPSLELLRCTKCDAPLALGDADAVTCVSCGTSNAVPAAYRELHRARIAGARLRGEAEQLLRRLDRPPSLGVKILARIFDQHMLAFFLLYGVPVGLTAAIAGLAANPWIARHVGYATPDDVPFGVDIAIMCTAILVMAFVPRALGIYANRRVSDRARLLGALAARPPKIPGGAAGCRMCGAPLAVAPDELVAVCSYCRAENAVHLETRLVAQTVSIVAGLGAEIRQAAEIDRRERRGTLRQLARELGRYVVRTALLGTGFVLGGRTSADGTATTVAMLATIATVLLLIYFVIYSLLHHDDDADDRKAGNDAPAWVGVLGPIVFLILLGTVVHHC